MRLVLARVIVFMLQFFDIIRHFYQSGSNLIGERIRWYQWRKRYWVQSTLSFGSNNRIHAPASLVNTSALVAEFIAAPASHMITAFIFLDPEVAERALLEILSSDKLFKVCLLLFLLNLIFLEFLASLADVKFDFALQAVVLLTFDAVVFTTFSVSIVNKSVVAVRSWAPCHIHTTI